MGACRLVVHGNTPSAEGGSGPEFPRTPYGEIDWDDAATWNGPAAVEAIVQLRETGATQIPDYCISTSSIVGTLPMHLERPEDASAEDAAVGGPIVAEGIFAAQMPALLEAAGVPYEAWYIDQSPVTTTVRHLKSTARNRLPPKTSPDASPRPMEFLRVRPRRRRHRRRAQIRPL